MMTHGDRRHADSFGEDAEQYDRARPSYPASLVDDLVTATSRRVLDVGCGTGIAARLFADRGCEVLGVESDARMAAVARRHGIDVTVAMFEAWDPPPEPFDLLISAQAWHWIDPVAGAAKAGAVLSPGGRFAAFWNSNLHAREVKDALDPIYQRHRPEPVAGAGSNIEAVARMHDTVADALDAIGQFEPVEVRRYPWHATYTRDQWLDQLPTHSDHRNMAPEALAALLAEVGEVIDGFGGQITLDHTTKVITTTRKSG